ncbi:MAG: S41 family peptidase [Christensenellales bacterium]|jgi:carboxyl-terminal processing protease
MKRFHGRTALCVLLTVVLAIALLGCSPVRPGDATGAGALAELQSYIEQYFYQDISREDLYLGAARGMVDALGDDYAQYFTAEEYAASQQVKSGKYKGIGVTFALEGDDYVILKVTEGGPAHRAGIQVGDCILSIDGDPVAGKTLTEISDIIKNMGDALFTMELVRNGQIYQVSMVTEEVKTQRVRYVMMDNNIAYIQIMAFYADCSTAFPKAIQQAKKDGAVALILDLRGNLGGDLNEMMAVANELLDSKLVLAIKNGDGTENTHTTDAGAIDWPMAVLVNGNSASASEALTGALQDYGRATVIGEQTFGKGIVQTTYHLPKSNGWIKMTTGAYYTPNGRSIHGVGLTPDIQVSLPEGVDGSSPEYIDYEQDTQLQKAVEVLLSGGNAQ